LPEIGYLFKYFILFFKSPKIVLQNIILQEYVKNEDIKKYDFTFNNILSSDQQTLNYPNIIGCIY